MDGAMLPPCSLARGCPVLVFCSPYGNILYSHGSEVKASACNVGDLGSIPGLGRSPGEGNGNPLQYSCLENLMDGGAWWATVHGVAKSQTFTSLHFIVIQFTLETNYSGLAYNRAKGEGGTPVRGCCVCQGERWWWF